MNEPVDDPLKPLDQVLEPDIRSKGMAYFDPAAGILRKTLADHHAEIACVTLNENVPVGVRQLFENAKNLVLYSWFFYRFHQPAELCGLGSLEMALREKAKTSDPKWWKSFKAKAPPSMKRLFEKARSEGWIRNEGFSVLAKTVPSIRNSLAHGAQTLHPDSLDTLKLCAEIINQLFPDRE